jgi:hypothetical protein
LIDFNGDLRTMPRGPIFAHQPANDVSKFASTIFDYQEDPMRRMILLSICLCSLTGLAAAQTSREYRGQGYGFVGIGGTNGVSDTSVHAGAGGEGFVHEGFGVGGEIGFIGSTRDFGRGFGIASGNASYHFKNASASGRLVPFVTGGYSVAFRGQGAHGANFGAGVSYWFSDRAGLRAEFRDHVIDIDRTAHFYGFRIGITFR